MKSRWERHGGGDVLPFRVQVGAEPPRAPLNHYTLRKPSGLPSSDRPVQEHIEKLHEMTGIHLALHGGRADNGVGGH